MSKERSLDDEIPGAGLMSKDAQEFIYGPEQKSKPNPSKQAAKTSRAVPTTTYRQPYTVKLRAEVVEAIDRISTFSKFRGEKLTRQAIVEEAIEEWIEQHKHLAEVPSNL